MFVTKLIFGAPGGYCLLSASLDSYTTTDFQQPANIAGENGAYSGSFPCTEIPVKSLVSIASDRESPVITSAKLVCGLTPR